MKPFAALIAFAGTLLGSGAVLAEPPSYPLLCHGGGSMGVQVAGTRFGEQAGRCANESGAGCVPSHHVREGTDP
jgi:hypothetical protein